MDSTIYESTLIRNSRSNDFDNISLCNISEINLISEPTDDNHVTAKSYTDFLSAIGRKRFDLSGVFTDQRKEFDNTKSTNLDSSTVNGKTLQDEKVSNRDYVDDQLDKNTVLGFNQILANYLKVSIRSTVYNFTKHDRKQSYYATNYKCPKTGGYLLQCWNMECKGRNINGKTKTFKNQQILPVETEAQKMVRDHPLEIVFCISKHLQIISEKKFL